ncbi:MAG: peptidoglycan DD-metalloendopeptidase family protein [bacterium]
MSTFRTPEARRRRIGRWVSPSFVLSLLLIFLVALPLFSPALGSTLSQKQAELNEASARLGRLQDSLNELAAKYGKAEARLAQIDDAISLAENDIARSKKDLGIAQAQLAERLVNLYKQNHSSTPRYLEVLFVEDDFTTVLQRFSLLGKLADRDQELFSQVQNHLEKSEALEATLSEKKAAQDAQMEELTALQAEMDGKMKSSAVEYRRLKNQVAALKEAARKAAEAAAAKAAAAKAAAAKAAKSSKTGGTVQSGSFVFPIDGPHSYANTWGAPRSGGRSHKGTDIMASKGTPAVACVSGTIARANPRDSGLGGISIWLRGKSGTSYYYAHLDGLASGIRAGASVSAGQVIGWVGDTGNAAGGAYHLHFEIHPGGGAAVNPYATLRAAD